MFGAHEIAKRFTHHPPRGDAEVEAYEEIRARVRRLALYLDETCPDSREKSLAFTHLEQAVMWANAAIARNPAEDG